DADGRVRASFCVLYMTGWAPDPSQQRPLAPGSAQSSLAAALANTPSRPGARAPRPVAGAKRRR
ncbi:MAG: SAM-dependent methyltransferase, partial [Rhodospirillales bacterium]|nr:SAM-dependent methyltransferase [Rhodospirillales bacterium]